MIDANKSIEDSINRARFVSRNMHPSRRWQKLVHITDKPEAMPPYPGTTNGLVEEWNNDLYFINVRRFTDGWPLDPASEWVFIGFACHDGAARHDWREMQRMKNEICGPEWEAIELFPAESRLMDPSNYYMLFCAPKIAIGQKVRQIAGPSNTLAPQRPWPPGDEPADSGKFMERPDSLETRLARLLP